MNSIQNDFKNKNITRKYFSWKYYNWGLTRQSIISTIVHIAISCVCHREECLFFVILLLYN